jgi:putative ABC transport system substrate-binding protein
LELPGKHRELARLRRRLPRLILLGLLAVASLTVAGNEPRTPVIGQVWLTNPTVAAPFDQAFRNGLRDLGYVEGSNVVVVPRYAEGDATRIPGLLQQLVALPVDVLLVSPAAVEVAKGAANDLPVVCATMRDPVENGFASSLSRPGGNLTGLALQRADTDPKRFELIKEVTPGLRRLGVLFEAYPNASADLRSFRAMVRNAGVEVTAYEVHNLEDIRSALRRMEADRPQALIVQGSALITLHRHALFGPTASRLPVISDDREFAQAGALLTYGPDSYDLYRRAAGYIDKILKGAKAAEIPIEQPTKFLLIVNLKTARTLGVKIPSPVLLRADEVIR